VVSLVKEAAPKEPEAKRLQCTMGRNRNVCCVCVKPHVCRVYMCTPLLYVLSHGSCAVVHMTVNACDHVVMLFLLSGSPVSAGTPIHGRHMSQCLTFNLMGKYGPEKYVLVTFLMKKKQPKRPTKVALEM